MKVDISLLIRKIFKISGKIWKKSEKFGKNPENSEKFENNLARKGSI